MHAQTQQPEPPELPPPFRRPSSRLSAVRASDASSPARPVFALGDPASAAVSSRSTAAAVLADLSEPPASTFALTLERQSQSSGFIVNQSDGACDRHMLLQQSQSGLAADTFSQINGPGEAGFGRESPSRIGHARSVSQTDIVALRNYATSTSKNSIWSSNHVPPLDQSTSPASNAKIWKPSASSSADLFRGSAAPISPFVRRTGSLLDVKGHSKLQFPQYPQHQMVDFSRFIHKGKQDTSSLDFIDDVGTLFSFDEDSTDSGTVNIDYSSSDRNNRTSSLDGSQESNSDAYTWVGSYSDAQIQAKSAESKWKSPTYNAFNHASNFVTAANVTKPNLADAPQDFLPEFSNAGQRQSLSPPFSSATAGNGRRVLNASPTVVSGNNYPRGVGDSGRFGTIGVGPRSNAPFDNSGFKLPPSVDNANFSPVISNPASPFKDSGSPLFLPTSDSSKNIWGAPDLNLGASSVLKSTGVEAKPANQDAPRLVPSELLRRNGPFIVDSIPQQQPSAVRPVNQKTKLNPHSVPFEYHRQTPVETSVRSLASPSMNNFKSFDILSTGDGAPSNFAESSQHTQSDSSLSYGLVKTASGFASSKSSPARNAPSVFSSFVSNAVDNNSAHPPLVPAPSTALIGGTTNGAASSPADHLRIVKEIQTSKLKVDESKLTTEYFEQLTREAGILQFHICPGIEERARQEIAFASVLEITRRAFGDSAKVHHFGSTALGFSLANADMDLSISLGDTYSKFTAAQLVEKLGVVMKNANMRDVKMLTRARVPIVKIREPASGMRCDIGFQSNLVLYNTRLLQAYSQIDSRFRELVFIVKYWSKQRNINEPYFGTLSSYCYILMIIHFLQVRGVLPCLQKILPDGTIAENIDAIPVHTVEGFNVYFYENVHALRQIWSSENNESIGELVVAFFKYYSAEFPYVHGIACVRTGSVVPKEDKGWTKDKQQELNRSSGATKDRYWLCVEDPFETTNNVGRPVDKETLFEVRGEFIRASKILCAGGSDESVLARVCEKAPVVISKKGTTAGLMRKW